MRMLTLWNYTKTELAIGVGCSHSRVLTTQVPRFSGECSCDCRRLSCGCRRREPQLGDSAVVSERRVQLWQRQFDAATEATSHVVQTSSTARPQGILRAQSQPWRQGPQTTLAEDCARQTHSAGIIWQRDIEIQQYTLTFHAVTRRQTEDLQIQWPIQDKNCLRWRLPDDVRRRLQYGMMHKRLITRNEQEGDWYFDINILAPFKFLISLTTLLFC